MGGHHDDDVNTDAHEQNPMNSIMEIELNEVSELSCLFLSNLCSVFRSELGSKRVG
jgi:hypothetical protein